MRDAGRNFFLGKGPLLMALCALGVLACVVAPPSPPKPKALSATTVTVLAINDVYRIEGLEEGAVGGLARVRALRQELERESPHLLMLHGGDFLFPSFASRMYRGEQMISVMNALDGDGKAFDPRMFVVFGNHEFERPKMRDAALLDQRIEASQFHWLGGNITFANGPDGAPVISSKNLSRTRLIELGGVRIGLFGITIPTIGVEYVADFAAEEATARVLTAELRAQKADVVVAVTHLNSGNDRRLLESLGSLGPDLVIGGHDHEATAAQVGGRWLLKADADARSATVVRLTLRGDGSVEVKPELRKLTADLPTPDPKVQTLVDDWQARHTEAFCAAAKAPSDCLAEVYGRTRTDLHAEENKIRGSETSLGNWITDAILAEFRPCGAEVAFINSGSLRINRDLPRDTAITRRHLEEIFAYPTPLHLLKLDGATLVKVAEQSVRGWPGSGSWLQVSGFAFRHDRQKRSASDVTWLTPKKQRHVTAQDAVMAVTGEYLIDPNVGDQDGYHMLGRHQIVPGCAANGVDLKALMIKVLKAAEPLGISPREEGRICQGVPGLPCLIPGP